DYATFNKVIQPIINARFPVLIRGRHGIGKSTVVYQLAKRLGLPVVERRASQMTEGDLLGLPKLKKNVTSWCPPEWLATACNEPVVLFLDEVDRATLEVRQGIFELCDSRKIAGNTLHKDTLIFACVNGGEHGSQYQVGEMDPAELDRYTVFDVEPTVEDWLNWAKGNISQEIWDFINHNHGHLEHKGDYEPNKVYPSRRSWERLSQTLSGMGDEIESSSVTYQISQAFIGFEGAVAFNNFLKDYDRQVSIEDLLDDGKFDLIKKWKINDHNAMVEKMKSKDIFSERLSDTRLDNLAKYFVSLPSEIVMVLWQALAQTDESTYNIAKLWAIEVDGTSIQDFVVGILNAES
ncbi:MAG: MoxR family ATPase, partial [Bacteroidota bacterium]|nr:MoxR family ATPase [Bacteroidota bacterium]